MFRYVSVGPRSRNALYIAKIRRHVGARQSIGRPDSPRSPDSIPGKKVCPHSGTSCVLTLVNRLVCLHWDILCALLLLTLTPKNKHEVQWNNSTLHHKLGLTIGWSSSGGFGTSYKWGEKLLLS